MSTGTLDLIRFRISSSIAWAPPVEPWTVTDNLTSRGKNPSGDGCRGGASVRCFSPAAFPYTLNRKAGPWTRSLPPKGIGEGRLLLEAEEKCSLRQSASTGAVLRLAGLYGRGRHLMVEKLKAGQPFEGNAPNLEPHSVADAAMPFSMPGGRTGLRGILAFRTAVIFQEKKLCPGWPANLAWKRLLFWKMTRRNARPQGLHS